MGLEPGPDPAAGEAEELATIVAARNEADRVGETVRALRDAFPGARIWVADDASTDGTAEAAMAAGAEVVRRGRSHGKGGNVTAGAERGRLGYRHGNGYGPQRRRDASTTRPRG